MEMFRRIFQCFRCLIRIILWIFGGVSRKRFFVFLAGNTNGAHHDWVQKLEDVGLTEVKSAEDCDYLVTFCPVASRVGTDVSHALDTMPAGKRTILVVMHHNFRSDHVVAESRRLVTNPNVHLTVDCLFYQHQLQKCYHNDAAWLEVRRYLGVSVFQVLCWRTWNLIRRRWRTIIIGCLVLAGAFRVYHWYFPLRQEQQIIFPVTASQEKT